MSGGNPDLPILDELGAEFTGLVATAYTAEGSAKAGAGTVGPVDTGDALPIDRAGGRFRPAARSTDHHAVRRRAPLPAAPPRRERGAQARRIGRRAAIVLVLLCAVGGVAFAALRDSGGDSGGPAHTAPTPLGRAGDGTWSFSAYRDEDRLCTVFVPRGGELSGNCGAAPKPGHVRTGSAIAGGRRYLFGIAGRGIERISVSSAEAPSGAAATWPTAAGSVRAPVDHAAARDAGFPAGDGWFVLDLGPAGRAARAKAPAVVTPLDARGRRAGPPYVDCSLGVIGQACKRRIEAAAAGS
ncbi:MAG TPA: hypothetical protein VJL81_02165 [Solirubrobacterales bacterium]|nr:hypothetical protein [Solirubrobacterales bacterium]